MIIIAEVYVCISEYNFAKDTPTKPKIVIFLTIEKVPYFLLRT